jgi:hypothetical protein
VRYIKVDSDGYAWLDAIFQQRLHKLGFQIGRANDEWILYADGKLTFETTDPELFDNYLLLLLPQEG